MNFFWTVWGAVAAQRLAELALARRNGRVVAGKGGYATGDAHYPLFVVLHVLFMASLAVESFGFAADPPDWWLLPFGAFVAAQSLRIWVMKSLGVHWNTRIYVMPGMTPIRRGPYRFMRHPNYAVVMVELLALPLAFGAYWTAVLFPLLNAPLLLVRIRAEDAALAEASSAFVPAVDVVSAEPVGVAASPPFGAAGLEPGVSYGGCTDEPEPKRGSGGNRA